MEKDSMGEMSVPESALYGASTQRAVLNFPISGQRFSRPFIRALGLIKWAAAQANADLGLLDSHRSAFIVQAAEEVVEGKLDDHFPLEIFQTGSGTSTNTNANEVIANRSCQLAGTDRREDPSSPERSVNMGQSNNDVIPSAIRQRGGTTAPLPRAGAGEVRRWRRKRKILGHHQDQSDPPHGRDASRLGQEFVVVMRARFLRAQRVRQAVDVLSGTTGRDAVGAGLNGFYNFRQ